MAKTIIHVNQHVIRANGKPDAKKGAPITVKQGKRNIRATSAFIDGPSEIVYSPNKPLKCGAKVWIETQAKVTIYLDL